MTRKEMKRVKVMELLISGNMCSREAADALGLCRRQIIRLRKKYDVMGEDGLIHGNKGRMPVCKISDGMRNRVRELYINKYSGFNFSNFTEHLNDDENIDISRSSVYRILEGYGIRSSKHVKHRHKQHRLRERMEAEGMMWQTDASRHRWFGAEFGYATLHGYIDDATGIVTGAYFTEHECSAGYAAALGIGIRCYGLPVKIYSDRHTIFTSPGELSIEDELAGISDNKLSNFGRGLAELGIGQVFALTPQAKGRIERLWETLQDRLPGEFRLLGITNIEDANRALPELIERHNRRFAVKPKTDNSAYVSTDKMDMDFELIFASRCERRTGQCGVISYNGRLYAPSGSNTVIPKAQMKVEVRETCSGKVFVIYHGESIEMYEIAKPERRYTSEKAGIINNSGPVKAHRPAADHPWRTSLCYSQYRR